MKNEIWKPVKGYEGYYEVSNLGNIRSLDRTTINNRKLKGKSIKLVKNHYGYRVVSICFNGYKKLKRVHVLVAEAFIPNPENKRTVNHIDGNKGNNCVDNLEWATMKEQNEHSYKTGLKKAAKGGDHYGSRLVLNTETGVFYNSLKIASEVYNINYSTAKKHSKTGKYNLIFA